MQGCTRHCICGCGSESGDRGGVGRAVQASVSRHTRVKVAQTERSGVQRLCGVGLGWVGRVAYEQRR